MNTMKMLAVSAVMAAALFVSVVASSSHHQEEVCQWQTFEARCAEDEVIVMREARYGRMRVGKCLSRNYFVGCSADVSDYMHGRCSGRQHCRVPVPDPVMFAATPCPKDLVSYLEADYECVKVAKWDKESCDNVMTATTGLIAKPADLVEDIRKKHHCPRRVVAQPGQTINIYLSDFYNKYHHQSEDSDELVTAAPIPECINYGHIAEEGTSAPAPICGGVFKKDQIVYRSKSNVVDITLSAPSSHSHHYLIKYEVVGCPTISAPRNGWVEVKADTAIVHCNNSHTASELVCSGTQWIGELPSCAGLEMPAAAVNSNNPDSAFANTGMLVMISIGVTLGVLVSIGLLVFVITLFSSRGKAVFSRQSSETNLLRKAGSQDSGLTSGDYSPVIDPNFVPVIDDSLEYGVTKSFMPSTNPLRSVINNLYDSAPRVDVQNRVNLTSFNNFATTLNDQSGENMYGPLAAHTCPEHKVLDVETVLPVYNMYDITGLASQHCQRGQDNVIVIDDSVLNNA